jgi:cytochrome c
MRAIAATVLALGAAALLAGCNKKSEAPVMPSSTPLETSAAPASSAAPTAEQQKMLAALPAPYNTGDPAAGEAKFAQCRSCHSVVKGAPNLTGPNLYGVFGTKAGEVPGFAFSDEMKASMLTWDAPTLDKWIENPKSLVPQTKMTFLGLKDAKDRQDVIAYLAIQRDQ